MTVADIVERLRGLLVDLDGAMDLPDNYGEVLGAAIKEITSLRGMWESAEKHCAEALAERDALRIALQEERNRRARDFSQAAKRLQELTTEGDSLRAELDKWEKLRDPSVLHVNLLRGELTLTKEQLLHLLGDRATPEITDEMVEDIWSKLVLTDDRAGLESLRAALTAALSHREKK